MNLVRLACHLLAILCLTVLTQIGGVAWILALLLRRWLPRRGRTTFLVVFFLLYAGATVTTQQLAPLAGRTALPCFPDAEATLSVRSRVFCALNRNYVTQDMARAAQAYADHMADALSRNQDLGAGCERVDLTLSP